MSPPSTTRSSPTPATCRTPWPRRWRLSVPAEWLPLAAGAYRDGTRVAGADTGLWTAIFRDNRGPLLKALGTLQERLDAFKYALMTDDEDAIRRWWDEAEATPRPVRRPARHERPEPATAARRLGSRRDRTSTCFALVNDYRPSLLNDH